MQRASWHPKDKTVPFIPRVCKPCSAHPCRIPFARSWASRWLYIKHLSWKLGRGKPHFGLPSSGSHITSVLSRASWNLNEWGDVIHQTEDLLFLVVSSLVGGGGAIQIDIFTLCNAIFVWTYLILQFCKGLYFLRMLKPRSLKFCLL